MENSGIVRDNRRENLKCINFDNHLHVFKLFRCNNFLPYFLQFTLTKNKLETFLKINKMKDKLKKVKKPVKLLKMKKKKLGDPKKKLKIQSMSVDDFMNDFVNDTESKDQTKISKKKKAEKSINKKAKEKSVTEKEEESFDEDEDDENEENDSEVEEEFKSHKKQLHGLKETDPEFYKYLQENDQDLLNFDDSDLDSDKEEEKVHIPSDKLEIASDESDYEPDIEVVKARKGTDNKVTKEMIAKWQEQLKSKNNIKTLREVYEAFHAALVSVSPDDNATSLYKVEGATIFNSVIRLCVVDLLPALLKALKLKQGFKSHPEKCKNWKRVKSMLRNYFTDLMQLCAVPSSNILRVLLKHIHQMSPFIACFPFIASKFLKRVIQLWAMDEEVVRVLAFLCALRLGNLRPSLLKKALKVMHITYVRNTRFVSPTSLPGINFMRQSLCEMFALDNTTSYQMAFIYIRQLAILLRNAITFKKKESFKAVYNWAFVSSLHLWADLFGLVPRNSPLATLIYPLTQIIIGTIKLIPSAQYFPLRFHCVRILINLSSKCEVFIPVLPFLLEIIKDFNFNKEHKKLTIKPMDLTCLLRCSKSQMKENGFKDALIENVHDLMIEYLAVECHRVSFPDMTVPCVMEIKQFLKTCKNANYSKKLKAILDKISENSKFIESERKKLNIKLDDLSGVEAAEKALRMKEPPFLKHYESWKKIHFQQQARKVTDNHKLGDIKLPVIYKLDKKRSRMENEPVGPTVLFPSDDDSDGENILEKEPEPPKKKKKKQEKVEKQTKPKPKPKVIQAQDSDESEDIDGEDIVEDLKYSDLK